MTKRAPAEVQTIAHEYTLQLFNELPGLMWLAEADQKHSYFNRSWLAFTGRTLEQEMADGWLEGVHPDDLERIRHTFRTCFEARQPFEIEYRLRHHSGEYRAIRDIGRPYQDLAGNFAGFLGQAQDLTEQKAMERILSESEAMFKGLFEYDPDGVVAVDEQGRILLANHQTVEMFGYAAEELVGKPVEILMPETYRRRHAQHVANYQGQPHVRPMGSAQLELVGQRKNGERFPVDVTLGPLQIGEKKLVLATIRDITERKQAEDELHLYKERLEELVEARTAELQREVAERKRVEEQVLRNRAALQLYAEQLARSNRDLQDFASIASHDLQEPLRKIQAFGERLESRYKDTLGEDGQMYVERMRDAAHRMQIMLNDLLTYSRVNTRGQPYSPVDLNGVVAGVISDLEIRLEETKGRVEVEPLPTIEADEGQMRQVFQNLIGNALKFHRPDVPPVVRVRALPAAEAQGEATAGGGENSIPQGPFVTIVVEDNGIGFDEAFLEKIFQPFHRLHSRAEFEGTGMGLAICRKIVERHGGSITARSRPGEGARFEIRLPLKR